MKEPKHISQLIENIKQHIDKSYNKKMKIDTIDWQKIAGEKIALKSSILSIKNNKLIIGVHSSSMLFFVYTMRDKILIKLRQEYPDIRIDDLKLILLTEDK